MKCNNNFCCNWEAKYENQCKAVGLVERCETYHRYENYYFEQANNPGKENTMIINLTQHKATQDQLNAGVVDMAIDNQKLLQTLLTFDNMPNENLLRSRAYHIASLVKNHYEAYTQAIIGGAPFFMRYLESALRTIDVKPLYAFSKRITVETVGPDGQALKTSVFKHEGFLEA